MRKLLAIVLLLSILLQCTTYPAAGAVGYLSVHDGSVDQLARLQYLSTQARPNWIHTVVTSYWATTDTANAAAARDLGVTVRRLPSKLKAVYDGRTLILDVSERNIEVTGGTPAAQRQMRIYEGIHGSLTEAWVCEKLTGVKCRSAATEILSSGTWVMGQLPPVRADVLLSMDQAGKVTYSKGTAMIIIHPNGYTETWYQGMGGAQSEPVTQAWIDQQRWALAGFAASLAGTLIALGTSSPVGKALAGGFAIVGALVGLAASLPTATNPANPDYAWYLSRKMKCVGLQGYWEYNEKNQPVRWVPINGGFYEIPLCTYPQPRPAGCWLDSATGAPTSFTEACWEYWCDPDSTDYWCVTVRGGA